MVDKRTIASKVEDLEQKCNVKRERIVDAIFLFHMDGEPHGCMGSQRMILEPDFIPKRKPLTFKEELAVAYSKEHYAELVKQCPGWQKEDHPWSTYEKWLEDHRCKCGCHGEDGKQPYYGEH